MNVSVAFYKPAVALLQSPVLSRLKLASGNNGNMLSKDTVRFAGYYEDQHPVAVDKIESVLDEYIDITSKTKNPFVGEVYSTGRYALEMSQCGGRCMPVIDKHRWGDVPEKEQMKLAIEPDRESRVFGSEVFIYPLSTKCQEFGYRRKGDECQQFVLFQSRGGFTIISARREKYKVINLFPQERIKDVACMSYIPPSYLGDSPHLSFTQQPNRSFRYSPDQWFPPLEDSTFLISSDRELGKKAESLGRLLREKATNAFPGSRLELIEKV